MLPGMRGRGGTCGAGPPETMGRTLQAYLACAPGRIHLREGANGFPRVAPQAHSGEAHELIETRVFRGYIGAPIVRFSWGPEW